MFYLLLGKFRMYLNTKLAAKKVHCNKFEKKSPLQSLILIKPRNLGSNLWIQLFVRQSISMGDGDFEFKFVKLLDSGIWGLSILKEVLRTLLL